MCCWTMTLPVEPEITDSILEVSQGKAAESDAQIAGRVSSPMDHSPSPPFAATAGPSAPAQSLSPEAPVRSAELPPPSDTEIATETPVQSDPVPESNHEEAVEVPTEPDPPVASSPELSPTPSVIDGPRDRWGFIRSMSLSASASVPIPVDATGPADPSELPESPAALRLRIVKETGRSKKWLAMLKDWPKYEGSSKVKSRARKGIPDPVRSLAWPALAKVSSHRAQHPDKYYASLLERPVGLGPECVEDVIRRDVPRTFPTHVMFTQRGGRGQRDLFDVCRAYALHDPEVGYCQGLSFIVGVLLMYVDPETAFWCLYAILNDPRYAMRAYFVPGMMRLHETLFTVDSLVDRLIPRMGRHFRDQRFQAFIYAPQWFMTAFSYSFRFDVVTRVWDAFLSEGRKILFRGSLAVLKQNEKALAAVPFDRLPLTLRQVSQVLDPDAFMKTAFRFSLKRSQIDALELQFRENPSM